MQVEGWECGSSGKYCVGTVRARNSSSSTFHDMSLYIANPTPRRLDTSR